MLSGASRAINSDKVNNIVTARHDDVGIAAEKERLVARANVGGLTVADDISVGWAVSYEGRLAADWSVPPNLPARLPAD